MLSWDMHPRHRLDLGWRDVAYGLGAVVLARGRAASEALVLDRAHVVADGLVTGSVRAAWDLLLTASGWPVGSEVVLSAITHPAMAALVADHGFVAVPVDLDLDTLLPTPDAVAEVVTARTRAVLVAQLFGGRSDLAPLADLCRGRGLLLVEDAAQAWCGPATLRSAADVTFVSFGLIKTASAVGGALVRVDDAGLRERLAALQDGWPVQARSEVLARLLRAAGLLALTRPGPYGRVRALCRWLGADADELLDRSTRTAQGPVSRRRRPSAPQLALLARRLRADDASVSRTRRRAAAGERLRTALPAGVVVGDRATRTHWLFPVRGADPAALVERLRACGIDASARTSNLVALTTAGAAADLMHELVYLPVYPELPVPAHDAVERLVRAGPA